MSDFTTLPPQDMLCFALYSASHALIRLYRPLLAPHGLTYPQYLVLAALLCNDNRRVSDLSNELALESSTLSPLLKRLASMELITRTRDTRDERTVLIALTEKGHAMRKHLAEIPAAIFAETGLEREAFSRLTRDIGALKTNLTIQETRESA